MGPGESEPAVVEWQWYYHLPSFAGWALIVALLVLVKENRNRQAWLILIPFLLLSEILWPWIERLFSLLSAGAALWYCDPFQWLLVAWTAVWLLSPWLARRRPAVAFVLALGLAAMVNIAAQIAVYQDEWRFVVTPLTNYVIFIFALLLAFVLSGLCCRKTYRPGVFWCGWCPGLSLGLPWDQAATSLWQFSHLPERVSAPPVLFLLPWLAVVFLVHGGCSVLAEPAVHDPGIPLSAVPGPVPQASSSAGIRAPGNNSVRRLPPRASVVIVDNWRIIQYGD